MADSSIQPKRERADEEMGFHRTFHIERKTKETNVVVDIDLDGSGESSVLTGVGFFDHMLTHLARHSLCDLKITCEGDLYIDAHHTVEDVGMVLGQAIAGALGSKEGITRYGHAIVPMEEALVLVAIDISGRSWVSYDLQLRREALGSFDTELAKEFFVAVAYNAGMNLHLRQMREGNTHHTIEAAFKAFAHSLRQAVSMDDRVSGVPSTKGVL
jgi:imidazoleglycerol-phosphate dehydratase